MTLEVISLSPLLYVMLSLIKFVTVNVAELNRFLTFAFVILHEPAPFVVQRLPPFAPFDHDPSTDTPETGLWFES